MPSPHGRDRFEAGAGAPFESGRVALLAPFDKGWTPRSSASPGVVSIPGTAVRWDDELYEVVEVKLAPVGVRYVLEPWNDGTIIRGRVEDYSEETERNRRSIRGSSRASTPNLAELPVPLGPLTLPRPVFYLLIGFLPWLTLSLAETPLSILSLPASIASNGISFLVHELGHTLWFLVFGSVAVPVIFFTIAMERSVFNVLGVWGLFAFIAAQFTRAVREAESVEETRRKKRRARVAWAVVLVYPALAFSPAHEVIPVLGGHGTEIVVAAFFLYRAVRGGFLEDHGRRFATPSAFPSATPGGATWERPVYALLGFCLWLGNTRLFYKLMTDGGFRGDYASVSFTGGDNDLIAAGKLLGLPLESVAGFMLVLALLVPSAGLFLAFRSGRR